MKKTTKTGDLLLKAAVILQTLTIASICGLGWLISPLNHKEVVTTTKVEEGRKMAVTAYIPTNNKVATMRKERPGLDAAVSPDRIDLLGKRVYIKCGNKSLGVREVVDLTDKSRTNTVDLMVPSESLAREFGVCEDCNVQVLP